MSEDVPGDGRTDRGGGHIDADGHTDPGDGHTDPGGGHADRIGERKTTPDRSMRGHDQDSEQAEHDRTASGQAGAPADTGSAREGMTREGMGREGMTREDVSREGMSREGMTREDVSREGMTREDVSREGMGSAHSQMQPGQSVRSRRNSGEAAPGDLSSEPMANLWAPESGERLHEQWREIQLKFLDDPKSAAREADRLISEVVDQLTSKLGDARRELSSWQGDGNGGPDTERLRVSVRRYRELLDRLLDV